MVTQSLVDETESADHSSREMALNAAHEVQDEMDLLCMQIKQLLAASCAIQVEEASVKGRMW